METFGINHPALIGARTMMDAYLQDTIDDMFRKDADTAEVTLKIRIGKESVRFSQYDQESGKIATVPKTMMKFEHSVSKRIQFADSDKGACSEQYEADKADDGLTYVVPYRDGQTSMFDE